jgi:hypothetical protein
MPSPSFLVFCFLINPPSISLPPTSLIAFQQPIHLGFWGDGSLMLTPGMGKDPANHMSNDRFRSQFGAWSALAFNILLVGNLSALNPYVLETW